MPLHRYEENEAGVAWAFFSTGVTPREGLRGQVREREAGAGGDAEYVEGKEPKGEQLTWKM